MVVYILSKTEMYEADRYTIENIGISGHTLMECAGQEMAKEIEGYIIKNNINHQAEILVICGSGNNGGDGISVARRLLNKGYNTKVLLSVEETLLKGEAEMALNVFKKSGYETIIYKEAKKNQTENLIKNSIVIIDALLGIGSRKTVLEPYLNLIELINDSKANIISLDIPSGTTSDEAEFEISVKANLTLSVQYPKLSAYLYPAAKNYGKLKIIDIGITMPKKTKNIDRVLWTEKEHLEIEKIPALDSHKGDNGKVVIVGGNKNMVGAPIMTAISCARTGAGLITMAIPENNIPIAANRLLEAMYMYVVEYEGSIIDIEIPQADILAVGMGLGRNSRSRALINKLLSSDSNLLLDADALYFLKDALNLLKNRNGITIITPHEAEMARLCNVDTKAVKNNRFDISRDFSIEYGVYTVLKGTNTIISAPDGTQYINSSGNPALAKGGSGDILSGIITANVGKAIRGSADEKYIAKVVADSVYVHGRAADRLICNGKSYQNIIATDIIGEI